ncbi:MAG: integrase arm-type DNA-binding domain-containing protein [Alteraurantiacibacter sp.]
MTLTVTALRNAKPQAKPYKLTDEKGLFALVQPSGGIFWRFKYRIDGRDDAGDPKRIEKKLGLGTYPEIGLKEARDLRDDARRMLAQGIDPAEKKRRDTHAAKVNAANTFEALAKAYIAKNVRDGLADATVRKREWFLAIVQKRLGARPIGEIAPFEILEAVRPFEAAKNDEKAHRALQFIGQVFRFAVANQMVASDPTRDLRGALASPKPKHLAAILEPKKVGDLLRAIDGYDGSPVTLIALKLSALLFVRPGELRKAEWSEIDFDAAVWRIPAAKMKGRVEHTVPLSRQAIDLLRQAQGLTGDGRYVFPSLGTPARCMSENTVNGALRRLGFTGDEMTAHGFRAMASTLLNESGKWSSDAIERALAHKDSDKVRAAYHRGAHWPERVDMAQWWADNLDQLRKGAEVIALPVARGG